MLRPEVPEASGGSEVLEDPPLWASLATLESLASPSSGHPATRASGVLQGRTQGAHLDGPAPVVRTSVAGQAHLDNLVGRGRPGGRCLVPLAGADGKARSAMSAKRASEARWVLTDLWGVVDGQDSPDCLANRVS